jgi:hypothetical protein
MTRVGVLALATACGALAQTTPRYGTLPLAFEPNLGQTDEPVRFLTRSQGMTVFFTDKEVVMVLSRRHHQDRLNMQEPKLEQAVVRMKLLGAGAPHEIRGVDPLAGIANYFIGNDPGRWRTGVPQYARVQYSGVYPGVDLVSYGNQKTLEYDFVIRPGADARQVQLAWDGADVLVNEAGDLVLRTPLGEIVQKRPRVYQETSSGRVEVASRYTVAADRHVGFELARYDHRKPLIIDPQLVYSTYLGGNSFDEALGIAVDSATSAYITGTTSSSNFPLASPIKLTNASEDVYVTKLAPAGNAVVYSTYLGGSGNDNGLAIAVDGNGAAYVTGTTLSTNFPVQTGFQSFKAANWDSFVTKLSPTGGLAYSSYLGGGDLDTGTGIAVDSTGAAYVTGSTYSTDFPTQSALQNSKGGEYDAFVTKVNPAGTALVYSTYLGGTAEDKGAGIAVDSAGAAYVAGHTYSTNFPLVSAYQTSFNLEEAFVAKLSPSGASLTYSTFLGGSGADEAFGIAVDSAGSAYVAGRTFSLNFPTTSGAYKSTTTGNTDVFVTKFTPAGNAAAYSSRFGGSGTEAAWGIAVNSGGAACVTGWTNSTDFPTLSPFQTDQPNDDAFVTCLTPAGDGLEYSTYLGGSSNDYAAAIAVDVWGAAYVAGWTDSANYPTVNPLLTEQPSTDGFVTKIEPFSSAGGKAQLTSPANGSTFTGTSVTFTWTSVSGATAYALGVGVGQLNFNIFDGEVGLATSQTVTGLPTDGSTIFVRLFTKIDGFVLYNEYTFKALRIGNKPVMISPTPGSVLPGASATFTWYVATGASSEKLDIGTSAGASDLFTKNVALATSQAVTGLPTDGSTIYVRLTANVGSLTFFSDYTYTAAGGSVSTKAILTAPASGVTLNSATATFTWTAATGAGFYWLQVGTIADAGDLFDQNEGTATSQTVSGLPTDGSTIYVRLWTEINGGYSYSDYTFKTSGGSAKAVLTSPTPGSTLAGGTITFTWTAGSGAAAYYLYVGTQQGIGDLYSQSLGLNTSQSVSGIPANGSTIYVRLWTAFGSAWQFNDYTFTASGGNTKAVMLLPTPGSTLSGASVTFSWSAGSGAAAYWLDVGTTAGGFDLFSQSAGLATSQTANGISTNGANVYVRLWTELGGAWQFNDYTYKAVGGNAKAAITSPAPGSGFNGASVTFTWTSVTGAGTYWLDIGTTAGGFNLYSQGQALSTSQTVTGLPTDGSTVYVRLWTATGGTWQYNDYTYKAAGTGKAALTAPPPGLTVTGTSVTFTWSAVTGAVAYWLDIGTSAGGFDVFSQGESGTSQTVTGLPTGGKTIYVRLWTASRGTWQYNDYTYTVQ